MKIADLLSNKKPVMLYVSSEAVHFTGGHHTEPVTIIDADERGVLVGVTDPHPTKPALAYYNWRHVICITPFVEDAADDDFVYVTPNARMPKDPHHHEKNQATYPPDPRLAVWDKEKQSQ
jgi:hypothetical protein